MSSETQDEKAIYYSLHPEGTMIGVRLGKAIALMKIIADSGEVDSPYDMFAGDAKREVEEALKLLGVKLV